MSRGHRPEQQQLHRRGQPGRNGLRRTAHPDEHLLGYAGDPNFEGVRQLIANGGVNLPGGGFTNALYTINVHADGTYDAPVMLLDMIDMAEGAFDRTGKPMNSSLVHPNMVPSLKKASDEVENDPELKRRLDSINRRQFQQWVDRENRRKLVD